MPSHCTSGTYKHLEQFGKIFYRWPVNSPDLSPIEMVWNIMKNKLFAMEQQTSNKKEFEAVLLNKWKDEITQDLIDNLISSFEYRLEIC